MKGIGPSGSAGAGRTAVWTLPDDIDHASWPVFESALSDELRRIGVGLSGRDAWSVARSKERSEELRRPITVVGAVDGTAAVEVAASSPRVDSLVLLQARLDDDAIDLVAELDDVALLTVIDPHHRDRLAAAVEGHLASRHDRSSIMVGPFDAPEASRAIARWVERIDETATVVEELTILTSDGWMLGADLHRPSPGAENTARSPAVVLMHSGRSDRTVFDRLARLMARSGVVALALDWRGRGTSTNLGRFVDFTAEQQAEVRRDVIAAYDYLSGRDEVDAHRLGVLGVAHGADFGAKGALSDHRTRAMALMTAIHQPDEHQRATLASGKVSGLYVTSASRAASTRSLRDLYELTTGPHTRILEFPEGVLGYQLFALHRDLEPTIASWFAEVLAS